MVEFEELTPEEQLIVIQAAERQQQQQPQELTAEPNTGSFFGHGAPSPVENHFGGMRGSGMVGRMFGF